jgi:molybdopterin-binding protein
VGTPSTPINTCQREGAVLKCHGSFNTGTVTGVTFQFPLPPGLTLSNAAYGQKTGVGKAYRNSGQSENVLIAVGGRNYLTAAVGNDAANKWTEAVGSTAYASFENTNFEFSVFIEGWAPSVQMSDQTDTRAVSFAANKASGQAVTANVTNISYTSVKDSHGAWNGTDTYIVQVPGDYLISATTNATGNSQHHSRVMEKYLRPSRIILEQK